MSCIGRIRKRPRAARHTHPTPISSSTLRTSPCGATQLRQPCRVPGTPRTLSSHALRLRSGSDVFCIGPSISGFHAVQLVGSVEWESAVGLSTLSCRVYACEPAPSIPALWPLLRRRMGSCTLRRSTLPRAHRTAESAAGRHYRLCAAPVRRNATAADAIGICMLHSSSYLPGSCGCCSSEPDLAPRRNQRCDSWERFCDRGQGYRHDAEVSAVPDL